MWAGTLAIWIRFREYAELVPNNLNGLGGMYSIESVLRGVDQDPLAIMTTAKIVKVLLQTAYFGCALIFLQKVVGPAVTVVSGAFIVTAPFLTGLDSALHVDGMAAITTFTGFCAIAMAAERSRLANISAKSITLWAIAGFFCANAWLTRYPAILLLGIVGLSLLLQIANLHRSVDAPALLTQLRTSLVYGITWLISGILTTFILWPALWVAPRSTFVDMWNYSKVAAGQGHENALIFMGVVKKGDPGLLFYPVSILWRTSPADWVGFAALLILGYWAWKRQFFTAGQARMVIMAIVYILVLTLVQSFGAKKFDRYILPVFLPIILVSSIGLMILGQWLTKLTSLRFLRFAPATLAFCINLALIGSILPYRLDYFNPLMGGSIVAERNMQMGWGQGGDEVVKFLNEQTIDRPITVQTTAVPSAFTYFLDDDSLIRFQNFSLRTPAGWYETDYYVAGIQQTQRDLSSEFHLLEGSTPVHSVMINGVSYFDIYNVRNLPLPDELASPTACNLTFDNDVTLMQIIGRDDTIDFYILTTGDANHENIEFQVSLEWPDGTSSTEFSILNPAPNGYMSRMTIPYQHTESPLDEATITFGADTGSGPLVVSAIWTTDQSERGQTHSECFYTEVQE